MMEGKLVVSNRPERLLELRSTVQRVLCRESVIPVGAASLPGRLGFLGSFLAGQLAGAAVRKIRKRGFRGVALYALGTPLEQGPDRFPPLCRAKRPGSGRQGITYPSWTATPRGTALSRATPRGRRA